MERKSNKCAFTIVAKNYIGLATVLEFSIKKFNPDVDFYIFVADEIPSDYANRLPENVLEAKNVLEYPEREWISMSFKYTLTEFCTAIKPSCFQYLLDNKKYENAIYFDPDIYVFSSLAPIYENLEKYSIVVTPHIVFPYFADNSDRIFLQSGPYNLGFLGLKNTETAKMLLLWWHKKLVDNCFDEALDFTFTDQKWMLMIHSYFDQEEILVSRNLGLNAAPWNFKERRFVKKDNGYEVECRYDSSISDKLVFIHYSGYDYKSLLYGKEVRPRVLEEDVCFDDVNMVMKEYVAALKASEKVMLDYISLSYSYNQYDNGAPIEKFHRRLYRKINDIDGGRFNNPFVTGKDSFFAEICDKGLLHKSIVAGGVSLSDKKSNKYLRYFNKIMGGVYKLIGYHRYLMLLRLLKQFSRYESQIFLLDKKYIDNNMEVPHKKTI